MKLSAAALLFALFAAIPASSADLQAVLATPRQRVQTADYRVSGHLVRVDSSGARTSYAISVKAHWFPGVLRILVDVAPPSNPVSGTVAAAHAHILLEMRPTGQSSIRIAHPGDATPHTVPFDMWTDGPLGSGFSYEDFLEEQYFWSGQAVVDQAKLGARDCDVLKSTPGLADKTHYSEVRTWLDHTIGFPIYIEKTVKANGTVKQFTAFGLRHEGGVWSASQIEEKNRGQAGSTLLIIDRGSAKANLGLADFSPEQLVRFP